MWCPRISFQIHFVYLALPSYTHFTLQPKELPVLQHVLSWASPAFQVNRCVPFSAWKVFCLLPVEICIFFWTYVKQSLSFSPSLLFSNLPPSLLLLLSFPNSTQLNFILPFNFEQCHSLSESTDLNNKTEKDIHHICVSSSSRLPSRPWVPAPTYSFFCFPYSNTNVTLFTWQLWLTLFKHLLPNIVLSH